MEAPKISHLFSMIKIHCAGSDSDCKISIVESLKSCNFDHCSFPLKVANLFQHILQAMICHLDTSEIRT